MRMLIGLFGANVKEPFSKFKHKQLKRLMGELEGSEKTRTAGETRLSGGRNKSEFG
jgi:hypothetical protein